MKKIPGLNFKDFKQVLEKLKEFKPLSGFKVNESKMQSLPRHEALNVISWLEGTWATENPGKGSYPTITPFNFSEKMSFTSMGQPLFNYKSETWNAETKLPLHVEAGFLRVKPNTNLLTLILAHNFALTTIEEGEVCDKKIILNSTSIARPQKATRPPLTLQTRRELTLLEDNCLEYILYMSTSTTSEMTEHLRVIYHRQ